MLLVTVEEKPSFRTITTNSPMNGPWPDMSLVAFVNPCDPSRHISIWSCGARSLKATRNNLFRSQPNWARNLKYDDVYFGWKDVEVIYERDRVRLEKNGRV